jgi:hypothetical protein
MVITGFASSYPSIQIAKNVHCVTRGSAPGEGLGDRKDGCLADFTATGGASEASLGISDGRLAAVWLACVVEREERFNEQP